MNRSLMRFASAAHVAVSRMTGGRLGDRFPGGAPVVFLTTTGRKSGQPRTVPLLYLQDRDDLIVVASQGGAPQHPGWYYNLRLNPHASAELAGSRFQVSAATVDDDDRARLWPKLVAIYPPYETYRQRTSRKIPILRLRPVAPVSPA